MVEPVDVAPLLEGSASERDRVDAAIGAAASTTGVLVIAAPAGVDSDHRTRESLLRVFDLPGDRQRQLWRRAYAPENRSIYRGWSPRSFEAPVDIYDLGPDVAHSDLLESDDPLLGATPLPSSALLPDWHERAASYYRGMERVGATLMRSLARWLGLEETVFDDAFKGGISTLRLMRYEVPPSDRPDDQEPRAARPGRGEHVDSGFVTLLAQHGVAGLQAQTLEGDWIDVPVSDGHLVVNFGALLERWTLRASEGNSASRRQRGPSSPLHSLLLRAPGRRGDRAASARRRDGLRALLLWRSSVAGHVGIPELHRTQQSAPAARRRRSQRSSNRRVTGPTGSGEIFPEPCASTPGRLWERASESACVARRRAHSDTAH